MAHFFYYVMIVVCILAAIVLFLLWRQAAAHARHFDAVGAALVDEHNSHLRTKERENVLDAEVAAALARSRILASHLAAILDALDRHRTGFPLGYEEVQLKVELAQAALREAEEETHGR